MLADGDTLFIPKKNSVVNVLGAVMSRGSFIYIGDLDYKDYISLAGGYTNYADKKNIYVLKVDGTAMKLSRGFFNWNDSESRRDIAGFEKIKEIEPGDSIVVSEKFERIAWMREIKDLSQILYQIAVAAAVVIDIL
jgi:protein involved in polysaccharide export with SLBB domain